MTTTATRSVPVWDPLLRLFHWSLVATFFIAYLTGEDLRPLHLWAGYVVTGLLVFRLLWGVVGPRHARFGDFVRPPREVLAYLRDLARGRARRYLGHNPAGGAMIVLLLAGLAGTVASGLLLEELTEPAAAPAALAEHDEDDEGHDSPAAEALEEVHEFFANLTLLLVFVHVLGVLVSSHLHHENLVRAMITGRKTLPAEEDGGGR